MSLRTELTLGFRTCSPVLLVHRQYLEQSWPCCHICTDLQGRCPQWLLGGLPDGLLEAVSRLSRIPVPLLPPESPDLCSPSLSQSRSSPQRSGWRETEAGLSTQLGKPGVHSDSSSLPPTPPGEVASQLARSLLSLSCATLEEEQCG